jgi:hypothetical protein
MTVHFSEGHFEIIVIQNQKLLLFNSFDYQTLKISFIMFYLPQKLSLNPENFPLELIGNIDSESDFLK